MDYVHRPGGPWADTLRAPPRTTLNVRLEPAGGYRWTTISSSGPMVAEITQTGVDAVGTATAAVALHAAGTAVLTATTTYAPDRQGPPTRLWRLTVVVEPGQAEGAEPR